MNKKIYMKPTMNVVKIQHTQMLCTSITETNTNLDDDDQITIGGGGSGSARVRSNGGSIQWDDWGE